MPPARAKVGERSQVQSAVAETAAWQGIRMPSEAEASLVVGEVEVAVLRAGNRGRPHVRE